MENKNKNTDQKLWVFLILHKDFPGYVLRRQGKYSGTMLSSHVLPGVTPLMQLVKKWSCVVGWPQLDGRCPPSHSITPPPQRDRGRKNTTKTHGL